MATKTQAQAARIGKNLGGYFGEGIDIANVLADIAHHASANGWTATALPVQSAQGANASELLVLHRCVSNPQFRFYVSAGIHGDEPAGPLAICELLRRNEWPSCAEIWLCPCLNPTAFPSNHRESASGVDLNRDYRSMRSPEVRAHAAWLQAQPSFDCSICLHEDWEAHGFYVYELNPHNRPSLAADIVSAASRVCPVDLSALIDGREARNGIIRPAITPAERPDWPEAFYLLTHKCPISYTLEAPSDFPLSVRVEALVSGTIAALRQACAHVQPQHQSKALAKSD